MPDDDRPAPAPPLGKLPRPGTHGEIKPRTPPKGVPTPPRQDDQPISFESITAVDHPTPALELLARTARTQHATEGIALAAQTLDRRMVAVEKDVGAVKGVVATVKDAVAELAKSRGEDAAAIATVQATLDAQDKYLKPLVDSVVSKATVEHAVVRAQLQVGTARELDRFDRTKNRRERITKAITTTLAIVGPAAALVLGALHLRGC